MNLIKTTYHGAELIVKNENGNFDYSAAQYNFSQNTHLYVKLCPLEGLKLCNIRNAKLSLNVNEISGEDKLLLYPVTDWNEQQAIAVTSAVPIAFCSVDTDSEVCEFDFTDAVEKYLGNNNATQIYEICAQNANLTADLANVQICVESEKPSQMVVSERAKAFDFSDKLSVFVDKKYGNLMLELSLASEIGSILPLSVRNLYNSMLGEVCYNQTYEFEDIAPFTAYSGNGFKFSPLECIKIEGDTLVYTDSENCKTVLTKSEDDLIKYVFEDSVYDSSTNILSINGQTLLFDENGFIVSKTDVFGNTQNFEYTDNKLISVTDGRGKTYSFAYTDLNMLTSVTSPDSRVTNLEYSGNMLESVTTPDGNVIRFESQGDLFTRISLYGAQAQTPEKEICIGYQSGRVTSVCEQDKTTDFEYSLTSNKTVITETADNEIKTVCVFDDSADLMREYSFIQTETEFIPQTDFAKANYAPDFGFENESWYKYGSQTENVGFKDSEYLSLYGKKCLEITSGSDTMKGAYKNVNNLAPGTYTLSAYFRADKKITDGGAFLRVTTSSGNILAQSEKIAYTAGGYMRTFVTFETQTEQRINIFALMSGSGTVLCDAVMLTEGNYPKDYNLISNPDFEKGTDGWQSQTNCFGVTATESFDGGKSLSILGDIQNENRVTTNVTVKTDKKTRESFSLSGYAKAPFAMKNAKFALEAKIVYADGESEVFTADFLPRVDEWQKTELSFCKSQYKEVSVLEISAVYGENADCAYFDCISLVRDSIETELTASDFETDTDYPVYSEPAPDTDDFEEVMSEKGVPLTETSFSKDAFGTIYKSFATNQNGDIVRETDSRGFNNLYDIDEDTSRVLSHIDRTGAVTEFTYDTNGKTTCVTKENSSVAYEYTPLGNLSEISRGDGMHYDISYTNKGALESVLVRGKENPLCSYGYTNGGNLKEATYANGNYMQATYNAKGQIIAEKWYSYKDGDLTAHYNYVYDNDGNLVRSIDLTAKKEYDYIYTDGSITAANEYRITLSGEIVTNKTLLSSISLVYDKDGNLKSKIYNDTEIKISEDETETVVSGKKYTSRSKSDGLSRKLYDELVLPETTLYRKFDYHEGAITAEHKQNGKVVGTPTTNLVRSIQYPDGTSLEYEYDGEERITKLTEKQGDTVVNITEYTYDAHGQLLTETVNGIVRNAMTYDGYGNILTKNGVVYSYGDPNWKDLLTSVGDNAITYDAQGNPISYFGKTLVWEKGRQLKSIGSAEFEYNANGIRTKKKAYSVTHTYTLDGSKILRESFGNNVIIPLYDNEDNVCGINFNGSNYFFVKNLQGDVIRITDEDANVVVKYSYDAWGKPTTVSDTSGISLGYYNPYRYRSYYYDVETKLYYVSSRYYDPEVGRFLNADEAFTLAFGGGKMDCNLFNYCENNPISNIDTSGYIAANIVGAAIGAIIGVVGGVFLGNWLADVLKLSGWKRGVFVTAVAALVGATAGAIGYFIGPYVAKIAVKLGKYIANLVRKGKIALKKMSANVKSSLRSLFKETCCFVAGTQISTPAGEKVIEKITVGDSVYAANPETGEIGIKKVTKVFIRQAYTLYHVVTSNEEIVTTDEHPFWVNGKGWVAARSLCQGDTLCLQSKETVEIIDVFVETMDSPVTVYNFEVEGWHTYFVGTNKILVHNKCSLTKIKDSYLKQKGFDAHAIKKEFVGKNNISKYDMYYDKDSGLIFLLRKGAKAAESIATGYFIK